uniref:Uncharacterized protein n=1 Tax=Anas platyrhynchos TaxID=8839 RepID=A0A8B9TXQ8_ANAPL
MPGCHKRYTDPSSLRKHIKAHGHFVSHEHQEMLKGHPAPQDPPGLGGRALRQRGAARHPQPRRPLRPPLGCRGLPIPLAPAPLDLSALGCGAGGSGGLPALPGPALPLNGGPLNLAKSPLLSSPFAAGGLGLPVMSLLAGGAKVEAEKAAGGKGGQGAGEPQAGWRKDGAGAPAGPPREPGAAAGGRARPLGWYRGSGQPPRGAAPRLGRHPPRLLAAQAGRGELRGPAPLPGIGAGGTRAETPGTASAGSGPAHDFNLHERRWDSSENSNNPSAHAAGRDPLLLPGLSPTAPRGGPGGGAPAPCPAPGLGSWRRRYLFIDQTPAPTGPLLGSSAVADLASPCPGLLWGQQGGSSGGCSWVPIPKTPCSAAGPPRVASPALPVTRHTAACAARLRRLRTGAEPPRLAMFIPNRVTKRMQAARAGLRAAASWHLGTVWLGAVPAPWGPNGAVFSPGTAGAPCLAGDPQGVLPWGVPAPCHGATPVHQASWLK